MIKNQRQRTVQIVKSNSSTKHKPYRLRKENYLVRGQNRFHIINKSVCAQWIYSRSIIRLLLLYRRRCCCCCYYYCFCQCHSFPFSYFTPSPVGKWMLVCVRSRSVTHDNLVLLNKSYRKKTHIFVHTQPTKTLHFIRCLIFWQARIISLSPRCFARSLYVCAFLFLIRHSLLDSFLRILFAVKIILLYSLGVLWVWLSKIHSLN